MALLGAKTYDPATAVTKSAAAALAMTALDTTNLRLTFTVPSNGSVLVRMHGNVTGATTFPQILLGVLEGATVRGRVAPTGAPQTAYSATAAATTFMPVDALYVVTGLTAAASLTWDAAYAVQFAVTGAGLKYGGTNVATAGTAWGAFTYEIYSTT